MKSFLIISICLQFTYSQSNQIADLIDSEISSGKQIISIGEIHQNKAIYSLFDSIFYSKKVQKNIDLIIVEFGNSYYQNILDRYISGKSVPMDSVKLIWRNTLVSPNTVWDSPVYENFFKTVREINKLLDSSDAFRVIAADKNINWDNITSREDMSKFYKKSRSEYIFETIREEVFRKNKRAILIAGGVHTSKISVQNKSKYGYNYNNVSVGSLIEFYYPATNFVINNLKKSDKMNLEEINNLKIGSVYFTRTEKLKNIAANTLSSLRNYDGSPFKGYLDYTLHDMADAIIYWGPLNEDDFARPEKKTYLEEHYWKELNRRSQLLRNQNMDSELRK